MKTIRELLNDADPVRQEPPVSSEKREALRDAVVAAALIATPDAVGRRFRLARLVTVSALAIGILFIAFSMWPRTGFETHAAVRFEVRLAEDAPAPGLREARVSGTDRSVYLHEEVVLSNVDIASAKVLPSANPGQFLVGLRFTADGTTKMRAATQNHIGKPMAILIDGEVVMAPLLRSAIGDAAEISGNFSEEEAERIANGI